MSYKLFNTFDHLEKHICEYYGLKLEEGQDELFLAPNVSIVRSLIEPDYLSIHNNQWIVVNRRAQSDNNFNCLLALNLLINPYVDRDEIFINTNIEYYRNISDTIEKVFVKKS